ncbi:hypothetical protein ACFXKC_25020 [Streptomyces sp. NPDC059340]|uniref:hypothetical protein n=1 Tax=Streptomyces sp. NPDC059340 TaxID=3346806 RepID=UPI0036CDEF85
MSRCHDRGGLAESLRGVDVVVDVTDAPSRGRTASLEFFGTATGSLLEAAASAGAAHHVVLSATYGESVHVAPVLMRPVSTDDVAAAPAHVAVGGPLFGVLEVAGPEEYHLDELTAKLLAARGGPA